MSSSNYPIIVPSNSDIEDAFSSTNTPDYISASPEYFRASLGNTSPDPSEDLSKYLLALLAISPFHDDPRWVVNRVMSSPNHHTSNIEDAFSSNFPDYISASSDYVPASLGKTYSSSSNNSFGLVPIASPTLLLFHDDPYMKVMHAYYAKESLIPSPTIVPPSSVLSLSPMFDSQEIPPPKCHTPKRGLDIIRV
nr:hypothetical protein [Tanacetum cinerariifolium]